MFRPQRLWRRQPETITGVNWSHPLANGLEFLAPLSFGGGVRDLVQNQQGTRTGLTTPLSTARGRYWSFGTSNYVDFSAYPRNIGATTPFTVAWLQEPRSPGTYNSVLWVNFGTGGVDRPFLIYQSTSAGSGYRFACGPTAGSNVPSFAASTDVLVDKRLDRFVLQCKGGSQSIATGDYVLFRNSERFTTASTTSFGSGNTKAFRIGAQSAGADPFIGAIGNLHLWSRILSDDEAVEWCHNEFATLAPLERRIWVPSAGGGPTYTLSAAKGTFTLTGNAAGLTAARLLTAAKGEFTLTGISATLARGYPLTADKGTFGLTGNAATFARTYVLPAESGAFVLNGQDASLVYSGEPAPTPGGGKAKKTRRRRYEVEIDGEIFEAPSLDAAYEILETARKEAEKVAAVAVERAAKAKRRPVKKVLADAKKALKVPHVRVSAPELADFANQIIGNIQSQYESALHAVEIAAHMARRELEIEMDDEDVILLI